MKRSEQTPPPQRDLQPREEFSESNDRTVKALFLRLLLAATTLGVVWGRLSLSLSLSCNVDDEIERNVMGFIGNSHVVNLRQLSAIPPFTDRYYVTSCCGVDISFWISLSINPSIHRFFFSPLSLSLSLYLNSKFYIYILTITPFVDCQRRFFHFFLSFVLLCIY